MDTLTQRVINNIRKRRKNAMDGNINCIPFAFKRFREDFPGLEQALYIGVTGATKSAKTQLASYLFLYHPIMYAFKHPDQLRLKIFYVNREEKQEKILNKFASFLLYVLSGGKYRVSPTDLNSTSSSKILNEEILNILESTKYQEYFEFFEKCVEFCTDFTGPNDMVQKCESYAENHGTVHYKKETFRNEMGEDEERKTFSYYEPSDPKEYRIVFDDHVSLVDNERGQSLREAMQVLSKNYLHLRDDYGYSIVAVHQQAMFENIEAYKMDMLEPSIANLADNKTISRDYDMCLSIFSPYKYNIRKYKIANGEEYDIQTLKDNFRMMKCLINRNGECNGTLPLYFDGACNYFKEMPFPSDNVEMTKINNQLVKIRNNKTGIMFLCLTKHHKQNGKNYFTNTKKTSRDL